jgi:hypothetical protein
MDQNVIQNITLNYWKKLLSNIVVDKKKIDLVTGW